MEEHAIREHVRDRARAIQCCANEAWRGRLCPYHEGFLDGALYDFDTTGRSPTALVANPEEGKP